MRIVEISPYDMDRPGGVQNHIRDLTAAFAREGHETLILAPRSESGPGHGRVRHLGRQRLIRMHGTVTEISFATRRDLSLLGRMMAEFKPDIVHLHTPWTPLMPWQAWRTIARPTVATFHATLPDPGTVLGRVLIGVARHFLKRVDAAVVPSEVPLAALPRGKGLAPVAILPPAIDLAPWFAAATPREGRLSVAFLGRLEHRKGVDVLMKAWDMAAASMPPAILTIAGSGPLEAEIAAWCAVRTDARHLPAPETAQAREILGAADIVAAPSRYGESFGLILLEAMAAGAVPLAAANPGYASTLAGPHAATLLYPPDDPASLADRLVALANDPSGRLMLRGWCRERAASFDMPVVAPRYVDLFRRVLADGVGQPRS